MDKEVDDYVRIIKPTQENQKKILERMASLGRHYTMYKD